MQCISNTYHELGIIHRDTILVSPQAITLLHNHPWTSTYIVCHLIDRDSSYSASPPALHLHQYWT